MYVGGLGAGVVATVTTGAALILPNAGGNLIVDLAVAVAAGLVTWGVFYARAAARK